MLTPKQSEAVRGVMLGWAEGVDEQEAKRLSMHVLNRPNIDRQQAIVALAHAFAHGTNTVRAVDLLEIEPHEVAAIAALVIAMKTSPAAVENWIATYGGSN